MRIWNEAQNSYYLQLLATGLNVIPNSDKDFKDLTEEEFMEWLGKPDLSDPKRKGKYVIKSQSL